MQILSLPQNLYKFYAYSRTQQCLDIYRDIFSKRVNQWLKLKAEGVSDTTCQEVVGISRATFYRHQRILNNLKKGEVPPHKKPKRLNKPRWTEGDKQRVLALRRQYPTYGKNKLAVILKRDDGLLLSESTVGRILAFLKTKGLLTKSLSAPRYIRRRSYSKGHACPWQY